MALAPFLYVTARVIPHVEYTILTEGTYCLEEGFSGPL